MASYGRQPGVAGVAVVTAPERVICAARADLRSARARLMRAFGPGLISGTSWAGGLASAAAADVVPSVDPGVRASAFAPWLRLRCGDGFCEKGPS